MPFDFLRYWRAAEDSGPIKNGRKTMQRHNSQRDKAPNWRSATKMISHALRSFHGYFMPHSRCFSTFALRFLYDFSLSLSFSRLANVGWYRNMQMSRDEIFSPVLSPFFSSIVCPCIVALTSPLRLLVLPCLASEGKGSYALSKDRPSWPPRTWCFHLWEMFERGHSTMGASIDDLRMHGIRVM